MLHESGMDCIQVWHITSNVGCMLTQPTESWIEAYIQPPCRASQTILHVFSKKIAAKETAAWGISVVSAPQGLRHVYSQRYLPIWAPASPNNIFCQKVFIGDRPKVWTAFYKWNAALTPSKMGTLGPLHWHFRPIAFSSFPPRWLSPGPWQVGIRRPAAGLYEYNKPIYMYINIYIYIHSKNMNICADIGGHLTAMNIWPAMYIDEIIWKPEALGGKQKIHSTCRLIGPFILDVVHVGHVIHWFDPWMLQHCGDWCINPKAKPT